MSAGEIGKKRSSAQALIHHLYEKRQSHFSLSLLRRSWHDLVTAPNSEVIEPNEPPTEKPFFPGAAIFFFAVLVLFYAALWLVVYWIMIARA
jgi:hypothetical protein